MTITVVVDDVGSHPHIDQSAVKLMSMFPSATLASVMVTSDSYHHSVVRFRTLATDAQLSLTPQNVGLHLNLTEGRTISKNVWSLQKFACSFFLGKQQLMKMCEKKFVLERHIEREVMAQMKLFANLFGFTPKRIDGHHHCHLYPCVTKVIAKIASRCGIRRSRLVVAPVEYSPSCVACSYAARVGPQQSQALADRGVNGAHALVGLKWCDGNYTSHELNEAVEKVKHRGSIEIMTHCKFGFTEYCVIELFLKNWFLENLKDRTSQQHQVARKQ